MQHRNPLLHQGHRERIKERFLKEGLDNFKDYEIIELLLFFGVPQRDVNELAHELINKFGSYNGVLDAPYEELIKVSGVGPHTATLICLCQKMAVRYLHEIENSAQPVLLTRSAIVDFLGPLFMGAREERLVLVSLDRQNHLINHTVLAHGDANAVTVSSRNVVHQALSDNAHFVILAHNHPGGVALPSQADCIKTLEIAKALSSVDIQILSHFIFGARMDVHDMSADKDMQHVFKTSWKHIQ